MAKIPTKRSAEQSVNEVLLNALSRIDRPGNFAVEGVMEPIPPGLDIDEIGMIGFPLGALQAISIREACEQAPFGKGEETLVDTSVRRVWQMMPDKFRLKNARWERVLRAAVKAIAIELGLESQQLEPQLYNLLLYEPGSFFLPHRDGEKTDGMVATMVVALPSAFDGGELIIRHDGQEVKFEFGAQNDRPFNVHYAAFYADCEHEVLPLREGFRLCLVYNLILTGATIPSGAPRSTESVKELSQVFADWQSKASTPAKLLIKLDHQYTRNGLTWDSLKGIDRTKARILNDAASAGACVARLAELTYWEQGLGEERAYQFRGRRPHEDNEFGSGSQQYMMHEIHETSLTAQLWHSSEGQQISLGTLDVADNEIIPPGALTDVKPEEQFEGYMGNYGDTLERWYRHAAILVWPKKYHFDIINSMSTTAAVFELQAMVSDLQLQTEPKAYSELRASCVQFARQTMQRWRPLSTELHSLFEIANADFSDTDDDEFNYRGNFSPSDDYDDDEESNSDETDVDDAIEVIAPSPEAHHLKVGQAFLACLEVLEETALTQEFVREILPKDNSLNLTSAFLEHCERLGLNTLLNDFKYLFQNASAYTLERNVRLYDLICSHQSCDKEQSDSWRAALANELVVGLKAVDRQKDDAAIDRLRLLSAMVKPMITVSESQALSLLATYTLSASKRYPRRLLVTLIVS